MRPQKKTRKQKGVLIMFFSLFTVAAILGCKAYANHELYSSVADWDVEEYDYR